MLENEVFGRAGGGEVYAAGGTANEHTTIENGKKKKILPFMYEITTIRENTLLFIGFVISLRHIVMQMFDRTRPSILF